MRGPRRRACEVATAMRLAWNGLNATCAGGNGRNACNRMVSRALAGSPRTAAHALRTP